MNPIRDLSWPTLIYLGLYMVTLAMHVVFMNYVLGGATLVVLRPLLNRGLSTKAEPNHIQAVDVLIDWLPFALGLAITAGVAPLLFVQVLYQKPFYTANLLLFNRWMLIVPVLIVGFYALYFIKSKASKHAKTLLIIAKWLALMCFIYVGLQWTANHQLALSPKHWVEAYKHGVGTLNLSLVACRFGFWFFGSWSVCAVLVAWQLRFFIQRGAMVTAHEWNVLAWFALLGLLASSLSGLAYVWQLSAAEQHSLYAGGATLAVASALFGTLMLAISWLVTLKTQRWSGRWLTYAALGLVCILVGVIAARESLRLHILDTIALAPEHTKRFNSSGLWAFLIAMCGCGSLIAWIGKQIIQTKKM